MSEVAHPSVGRRDAYGRFLRIRQLRRNMAALGPRIALLGCGELRVVGDLCIDPHFSARVCMRIGDTVGDQVRADFARLPIQSGALTGVVACDVLGALDEEGMAAFARESQRVLQPGGTVLLFGALEPSPEEVERVGAAITSAGLELLERRALRLAGAETTLPRPLWAVAAWWGARGAALAAEPQARVECALVAVRPGGLGPMLPTASDLGRAWFFGTRTPKPPRWRRGAD